MEIQHDKNANLTSDFIIISFEKYLNENYLAIYLKRKKSSNLMKYLESNGK
jgi:hypothetical protein